MSLRPSPVFWGKSLVIFRAPCPGKFGGSDQQFLNNTKADCSVIRWIALDLILPKKLTKIEIPA